MSKIDHLFEAIEKKRAINSVVDLTIDLTFQIEPGNRKARLRRNEAHFAVMKALDVRGLANWRIRKLIKERLLNKGVKAIIVGGRRFFTGIAFKERQND